MENENSEKSVAIDIDDNENSIDAIDNMPQQSWRGCSMEEIHRNISEFELQHVRSVRPAEDHTVLHHYPIRSKDTETPRPLKSHHKWDAQHVRLPCSAKSLYPVTAADGSATIQSRWMMIVQALLRPINNSHELQEVILAYNSKYEQQWNFRALHSLFEEDLDESEARVFFEDLLPRIIRLALRLPELVQAPIPLLKQGQNHSITLTQEQVSCLLANAFLCTFPRRNTRKQKSEYSTFPDINFNRLFQSTGQSVLEKLKCICHYFRRVCPTERDSSNVPTGVVTFTRLSLTSKQLPQWEECEIPLGVTPLHINANGTIEDQGVGLLQVDFANKFLGGGVLGSGCVQEEIRFVICPELLISKLFTECLRPTEALLMIGCERYSNYTGYASTFKWAGNHEDFIPCDSSRRRQTHIVAIDALAFAESKHQYREDLMLRELNKAYVGFRHTLETPAPGVASGNWGCGAFGGEAKLKALLQLMACTMTKRPLVYFTFGDVELRDEVHRMHTYFIEQNVRVRDLWNILRKCKAEQTTAQQLYKFIYKTLDLELKGKRSPQQKKLLLHSTTSASSSRVITKKCLVGANKSQDIFASSSESDENESKTINIDSTSASTSTYTSTTYTRTTTRTKTETQLLISDESEELDAVLLAAVDDIKEIESGNDVDLINGERAVEKAIIKSPSKLRQRSLLEMLDQCYTEDVNNKKKFKNDTNNSSSSSGGTNASKRHKTDIN